MKIAVVCKNKAQFNEWMRSYKEKNHDYFCVVRQFDTIKCDYDMVINISGEKKTELIDLVKSKLRK